MSGIELSIIAPAHNEEANIEALVDDVHRALEPVGVEFELILVDDGSTDGTRAAIAREVTRRARVRGLALASIGGGGHGQSAGFEAGIAAAGGPLIAFMDADRQNDPADLPGMLEVFRTRGADMVQGDRSANRRDDRVKRITSWVGRTFRRAVLRDTIRDTGCSLRVLRRELAVQLPLRYRGMHRFIPFYARLLGFEVVEVSVRHRPRTAGKTKYGIRDRALPGLYDLLAVRWMRSRIRIPAVEPIVRLDDPVP